MFNLDPVDVHGFPRLERNEPHMKKLLALMVAAATALTTLAGCAAGSPSSSAAPDAPASVSAEASEPESGLDSEPVTLTFWYSANESDPTDYWGVWQRENIELFQKLHPNITIEPTVISDSTQYLTKITAEIAAGNAPDVFQAWLFGRLTPFVEAGRIEPLDDLLAENAEMNEIVPETSRVPGSVDGKVYALPCLSSGEVVYYNKAIFAENGWDIPETYEELEAIAAQCLEKGLTPIGLGNDCVWLGSVSYTMLFQRMFGTELYNKVLVEQQPLFDSPEFAEAGQALAIMVEQGFFTPNANAVKPEEAQASFKEGGTAMYIDGTWRSASFYEALGDDLGFFNFPDMEGGQGSRSVWIKSFDGGLAISADSPNKEAAKAFYAFMFSRERQKAYGEYGALLATADIELDPDKVTPLMMELNQALASTTESYGIWDNLLGTNLGAEFNKTTQAIIGGKDPAELFATLNKNAQLEWEG